MFLNVFWAFEPHPQSPAATKLNPDSIEISFGLLDAIDVLELKINRIKIHGKIEKLTINVIKSNSVPIKISYVFLGFNHHINDDNR
jgi:hypothetical protein